MSNRATRSDRPALHEVKAELFRALGHPLRVRVLELLSGTDKRLDFTESTVSALLHETGIEPSTLSTHLAVLRRAGVVQTRREGTTIFYRLADPSVQELLVAARTFLYGTLSRNSGLIADLEQDLAQSGDAR